ncbi:MAG: nucleotidyltransferase family protein [Acidimicrobiia bacterium]|nr:nucleotidyltransferase family protein [Acidimicrobiia bacterium]
MSVAALILAAGSSTRLGSSKQLLPWGEGTLLGHVIERTRSFGFDEIWVVIGHEAEAVLDGVDFGDSAVVINEEYEEGMASSLRVGLDSLLRDSRADKVLIAMGDQPEIRADVVAEMLTVLKREKRPAIVPRYRYTWSNPVIVDRSLWTRLMSLEGDTGAQRLLQAHPEWVREVWVEHMPPRDVDTQDDVAELQPRK